MCGIAGAAGFELDRATAAAMLARLEHRGPDDCGEWEDLQREVWLGHRRLSIIDLSSAGHQPMVSPGGRYVITYNGEVYNYRELRSELEKDGLSFNGDSDTEVVLAAIEKWGLDRALQRFVGMFAFGLFDRTDDSLYLVRDRVGVKPLYYAAWGRKIAFASELKALALIPWVDREIDLRALRAYFDYLTVPAPASVFRGVKKVLPAHVLHWRNGELQQKCYWDLRRIAIEGARKSQERPLEDAADELEEILRESIRLRLVADVPLGCFLSGGIDSSTVAALMQSMASRAIQTFSIGFNEASHDESRYAAKVAKHLGTAHHEARLTGQDALRLIPEVLRKLDEPFADNSVVPSYALARLARERVTVAMSGDGGDELFGGYPRYFWAQRIIRIREGLTPPVARAVATALAAIPAGFWDGPIQALTGARFAREGGLSERVRRFASYLRYEPTEALGYVRPAWGSEQPILPDAVRDTTPEWAERLDELDWASQMMLADQLHYLPDDILHKVDRASMAVSLEAREPLLDHRLIEWSWSCPQSCKLAPRGDRGKLVLRAVLRRHVPDGLIERPKSGFGLPIAEWLRNDLKGWAGTILQEDADWPEFLDRELVTRVWKQHLRGEDHAQKVWTVLTFLEWYRTAAA